MSSRNSMQLVRRRTAQTLVIDNVLAWKTGGPMTSHVVKLLESEIGYLKGD